MFILFFRQQRICDVIFSNGVTTKFPEQYLVLDTETTGLNQYRNDEAVEISVVDQDENIVFDSLIKPKNIIEWSGAQRIHGISPEMVADAPLFEDVWMKLGSLLAGQTIFIYNAPYDIGIMHNMLLAAGFQNQMAFVKKCVDVMVPYANLWGDYHPYYGTAKWQKLTVAVAQQGIDVSDCVAHRALGDCVMTLRLLKQMLENYDGFMGYEDD